MNLIIFGPPGAGKGTQSNFLSKKYNLYSVSTGELLRNEVKNKTAIGKEIEKIISEGDFATDDIVNTLLSKVIINPDYRNRIIFDGYPRNISQAKTLEDMLKSDNQTISHILFLNLSRSVVEKRIIGRVICDKCNSILNEYFNKNSIENHSCGKIFLKKRTDDNKEAIINRYDVYMEKTKPVLDFFSTKNFFHEIDGNQEIEVISAKIDQILSV